MLRLNVTTTSSFVQTRRVRRLVRPSGRRDRPVDVEVLAVFRAASSLIGNHHLNGIQPLFNDPSTTYFPTDHSSDFFRRCLTLTNHTFKRHNLRRLHHLHQAAPPPYRMVYCRLLSSEVPQASNEEESAITPALDDARESHERRVAEAQAKLVEQREREQEAKKQKEEESERKRRSTRRHFVVNTIHSWFAKDPEFYESTMKALNISPENEMNPNEQRQDRAGSARRGSGRENNGDDYLSGQFRGLYVDSIQSFRNLLEQEPPPSLQSILQQLEDVGFGDPNFNGQYQLAVRYEFLRDHYARLIKENRVKLNLEQDEIEVLEFELVKDEQLAQNLPQPPPPHPSPRQISSENETVEKEESSPVDQTIMAQTWHLVSSFLSNTRDNGITDSINSTNNDDNNTHAKKQDIIMEPAKKEKTRRQLQKSKRKRDHAENHKDSSRSRNTSASSEEAIREEKMERLLYRKNRVNNFEYKIRRIEKKTSRLLKEFDGTYPDGYRKAKDLFESSRDLICQELGSHIQQRHDKLLKQYQVLDGITDLTKPHEWYIETRQDRRKIIFHGGPTNSGKTYNALQRLREAERGLYLAPLRLLAAEIYETLTAEGIETNLFTGQERRATEFATHTSATVEMANTHVEEYDVAIIDEIQMVNDPSRGAAWTRALLGLRCKEIHVCGGLEAQDIVERIVKSCGDDLHINTYDRFRPLQVSYDSLAVTPKELDCYKKVQPGDCVVAFSTKDIFAIQREIETSTNHKCCLIYGKLPPETRADQARRFNDPESGYDILVASDAIGMGLNLNIRRIIFNSLFKYNGHKVVRLDHSSVKQIAGRAGRRNSPYPDGIVTCRDPRDMAFIHKCITTDVAAIEKAALLPTAEHFEAFHEALKTHSDDIVDDADSLEQKDEKTDLYRVLRQFDSMATVKGDYFLGRKIEMEKIARRLQDIPLHIRDSYTLCLSPIMDSSDRSLEILENVAWQLSRDDEISDISSRAPSQAKSFDDLGYLCSIYGGISLSMWFQFKFPSADAEALQADIQARREEAIAYINEALSNAESLKLNHCYIKQAERYRARWQSQHREKFGKREKFLNDPFDDQKEQVTEAV